MLDLVKSPLVILSFLLALLFFTGWGTYNIVYQAFSLYKESRETEGKIQGLLKNKDKLESDLKELQSKSAVVREAKSRLNLKSPGEEVLVVVDSVGSQTPKTSADVFIHRASNVVDDKKIGTSTYGGAKRWGISLRIFLDKLRFLWALF